ncbi:hypothetical protein Tco_1066123 [Tanacetum coccineum]
MASQDARLSKFEADFKRQQSKMTNKINTFLKAINDRMMGALPSDMVKNPKLNVNPTSSVLSAHSYPMEDPQSSSQLEKALEDEFKDLHLKLSVLEVLAHDPIYNAILDIYVEGLELVIMEYLVNISKMRAFWSLNEDILKITILTTNTPYPLRKIRRIRACTHQRPQRNEAQYAISRETQYAIFKI